ncbi:MAG: hypothetical protein J5738_07910 [Lachnospiraceae bacterium]|nr:hypothetical protein [Lachnospiraceae bacterium]
MRTKNLILKRIVTLLLLLVILAGMMPMTAGKAGAWDEHYGKYRLSFSGYNVSIADKWFPGGTAFRMPSLPNNGYKFVGWKCGSRTYAPGELIYVNGNMSFTAVWRDFNVTVVIRYFDYDPVYFPKKKEYRMTTTGTSSGNETMGQYFSRKRIRFSPEYSNEYNPNRTINDDMEIWVWDWGSGPD